MQYLTSVGSYNVLQQKDYCLYVSLASLFQTALHFCHLGWHRWVVLGSLVQSQHCWFSGRMLACHAGGPGSIPGQCSQLLLYLCGVRVLLYSLNLHLR